jgi:hypothetical protein
MARRIVLAAGLLLLATQQVTLATDVGRTEFLLASIGSDGVPADTTTAQPALSANGDYTAFVSPAELTVGAEVPQHPTEGRPNQVYVRGRLANTTTLLSDVGAGDATAPTIDGDGRLVAYETTNEIDVADRQATGTGAFDTPANLVLHQVTDNPGDPRYQRLIPCPAFSGVDGGSACGPQLSADGSTLAYPALLSPESPSLQVSVDEGQAASGNIVDLIPSTVMTTGGAGFDQFTATVQYQNVGRTPITFTGPPTVTDPFQIGPFSCTAVETPGQSCSATVTFDGAAHCPNNGQTTVETGNLLTNATTPAGQTAIELVATCAANIQTDAVKQAACPAAPTGLNVQPAPEAINDNQGTPLVDLGPTEVGQPLLESVPITGTGRLDFQATDCSIQLINAQSGACQQGQFLAGTSCFAYFLVNPQDVGTTTALVTLTNDVTMQSTYVAVTGQRHVVVARQGPDFAQGTIVSVDSNGTPIPGADEPRLSTTGSIVAFAAGQKIWRHEQNSTILVSCLTGNNCPPAGEPTMSGDGGTIAFTVAGHIYVHDATTTQLLTNNGQNPVISQDGSTVAFLSTGDTVTLNVANLGPGTPGTEVIASSNNIIDLPAIDATGRVVAMSTNTQLLPSAPTNVTSTYTFERFDQIQTNPTNIGYGRLVAGLPGQTRTVTVTDTGLGPTTVISTDITGPFILTNNTCQNTVLHQGQSCVLTVLFTPTTAGTPIGRLTVTTEADGEPSNTTNVNLDATVVVPTTPLMTLSPTVADGGQVVHAKGTAFPPGITLTLKWNQGLGIATVTTDTTGGFAANLVIFPDDLLGDRTLMAIDPTGATLATLNFLVEASPQEPPFHTANAR